MITICFGFLIIDVYKELRNSLRKIFIINNVFGLYGINCVYKLCINSCENLVTNGVFSDSTSSEHWLFQVIYNNFTNPFYQEAFQQFELTVFINGF
jgi:hypothetical protein